MMIWVYIVFIIMVGVTVGILILSRKGEREKIDTVDIISHVDEHRPRLEITSEVRGRVMATRIGDEWWAYFWLPFAADVSYGIDTELKKLSQRVNEVLPGGLVFQTAVIKVSTLPELIPPGILCRLKVPAPQLAERGLYSVIYALQEVARSKAATLSPKRRGTDLILPIVYPLFVWAEHLPIEAEVTAPSWAIMEQIEEEERKEREIISPGVPLGPPPERKKPYKVENEFGSEV